jgi:hypothetical protein
MESLRAGQVMRLIGITHRQLDHLTHDLELPVSGGYHRWWDPGLVRRIQVMATLARANPFPVHQMGAQLSHALAARVMAGPEPEPVRFVTMTHDGEIRYVTFLADLEPYMESMALVAVMPALWPDIGEAEYRRVMGDRRDEPGV